MTVITDLINDSSEDSLPGAEHFRHWAETTLNTVHAPTLPDRPVSLSIRIVDSSESAELNHRYRDKESATNVLSFGCDLPDMMLAQLDEIPLGDLVICAAVVRREAQEQNKTADAHWAHMVVHGILHLSGYDHIDDDDARHMEAQEILILDQLGFSNPYLTH
ncbi:MAG: rRNA maturation RNase YbeY [Gammaproteobacteria bacterium]|nr:rRNA maturation RNase YbeY [Gammaproteobacteria bacterium]|tara:strand:- start:1408 stop:1893 length:486 start_codon:yes stop_codon:yes gene_type:complete